mmetsp:Transcript_40448/g.99908  ORF Transcript_40448/g.99908 Transcript_40448/m.99908 type:complete len:296 (+) Transcript_40448:809-1696(+)
MADLQLESRFTAATSPPPLALTPTELPTPLAARSPGWLTAAFNESIVSEYLGPGQKICSHERHWKNSLVSCNTPCGTRPSTSFGCSRRQESELQMPQRDSPASTASLSPKTSSNSANCASGSVARSLYEVPGRASAALLDAHSNTRPCTAARLKSLSAREASTLTRVSPRKPRSSARTDSPATAASTPISRSMRATLESAQSTVTTNRRRATEFSNSAASELNSKTAAWRVERGAVPPGLPTFPELLDLFVLPDSPGLPEGIPTPPGFPTFPGLPTVLNCGPAENSEFLNALAFA